eukprot:CAMPEP_0179084000 /NCGR_PEP_ID=MMETSP0796-20121207/37962_1 /TAXON_ID=73915 /ORGANISM="Pyrodinium bahamense, Strain pbaha01" /LENGTH=489 /DNA_ID=CAMNT_0020781413 /DNA_START=97 /DNA_END=1566 /DNA_ORIENTATION=-
MASASTGADNSRRTSAVQGKQDLGKTCVTSTQVPPYVMELCSIADSLWQADDQHSALPASSNGYLESWLTSWTSMTPAALDESPHPEQPPPGALAPIRRLLSSTTHADAKAREQVEKGIDVPILDVAAKRAAMAAANEEMWQQQEREVEVLQGESSRDEMVNLDSRKIVRREMLKYRDCGRGTSKSEPDLGFRTAPRENVAQQNLPLRAPQHQKPTVRTEDTATVDPVAMQGASTNEQGVGFKTAPRENLAKQNLPAQAPQHQKPSRSSREVAVVDPAAARGIPAPEKRLPSGARISAEAQANTGCAHDAAAPEAAEVHLYNVAFSTEHCSELFIDESDQEDGYVSPPGESAEILIGPTHLAVQPMRLEELSLPEFGRGSSLQKVPLTSMSRRLCFSDARRLARMRPGEAPLSFGSTLHLNFGPGQPCRPCMFERWAGRCDKSWLCDFCHLHTVPRRRNGNAPRMRNRRQGQGLCPGVANQAGAARQAN